MITYSIECLVYYHCGACGQWWTIGDGPIEGDMHCPRCRDSDVLGECRHLHEPIAEHKERLAKINKQLQQLAGDATRARKLREDMRPDPVARGETDTNPWRNHPGTARPAEYGDRDAVELCGPHGFAGIYAASAIGGRWADHWHRPHLDAAGNRTVIDDGSLEPWAEWTATDDANREEPIWQFSDPLIWQFSDPPIWGGKQDPVWDEPADPTESDPAPDRFAAPGDPAHSLRRVIRQEDLQK